VIDIRCPRCNALNLKLTDGIVEVKIGAFKLIGKGRFHKLEVTCRNRDCKTIFVVDQAGRQSEV
jgi:hypothetical protein